MSSGIRAEKEPRAWRGVESALHGVPDADAMIKKIQDRRGLSGTAKYAIGNVLAMNANPALREFEFGDILSEEAFEYMKSIDTGNVDSSTLEQELTHFLSILVHERHAAGAAAGNRHHSRAGRSHGHTRLPSPGRHASHSHHHDAHAGTDLSSIPGILDKIAKDLTTAISHAPAHVMTPQQKDTNTNNVRSAVKTIKSTVESVQLAHSLNEAAATVHRPPAARAGSPRRGGHMHV